MSLLSIASVKLVSELPELVRLHFAHFLTTKEIICVSTTCKQLISILPTFLRIKGKSFPAYGRGTGRGIPQIYFDGPKLKKRVKKRRCPLHDGSSSRNFFRGQIYCYANFFCDANFSIVFGLNFRGQKSLRGANCLRGAPPLWTGMGRPRRWEQERRGLGSAYQRRRNGGRVSQYIWSC